jgi:hypothetical protein
MGILCITFEMQNKQGILGAGSIHDTLWQTDIHTHTGTQPHLPKNSWPNSDGHGRHWKLSNCHQIANISVTSINSIEKTGRQLGRNASKSLMINNPGSSFWDVLENSLHLSSRMTILVMRHPMCVGHVLFARQGRRSYDGAAARWNQRQKVAKTYGWTTLGWTLILRNGWQLLDGLWMNVSQW